MSDRDKKIKAVEIFKTNFPGKTGLKVYNSDTNSNEVEFIEDGFLYCTINIRSGKIKGI